MFPAGYSKRNRRLLTVACTLTACAAGAGATRAGTVMISPTDFLPSATVVDFETGSGVLPIITGATIIDDFGATPPIVAAAQFNTGFFDDQIMTNVQFGVFTDVAIQFTSPVQAAGAWVGKIENGLLAYPATLEVRVLGSGDVVLKSTTVNLPFPEQGDEPLFVGFWSSAGIERIEWRVEEAGFFGVDNFTFGAATPEPATGFTLSLLALAALHRKRPYIRCG